MSHDDRHQAATSRRSVLVSSLVLRSPPQAKSTEASSKCCYIGATRPRPGGRQDGGHRGAQDSVTTRAFGKRRPPFVRITRTSCLPSNLAVVGSLHAQYLGRGPRPLYIEIATIVEGIEFSSDPEAIELTQVVHRTGPRTPLAKLFFPCTVHHQPKRQSTTPHTGVGYYTATVARTSINLMSLVLFIVSSLDHARRLDVDP